MTRLSMIVAKNSVGSGSQILAMPDYKKTRVFFPCGSIVYFPDEAGLVIDASAREYFDMSADAEFVKENVPDTYIVREEA